jgi:hypothetical protein
LKRLKSAGDLIEELETKRLARNLFGIFLRASANPLGAVEIQQLELNYL